jgi:hypothetical protein
MRTQCVGTQQSAHYKLELKQSCFCIFRFLPQKGDRSLGGHAITFASVGDFGVGDCLSFVSANARPALKRLGFFF